MKFLASDFDNTIYVEEDEKVTKQNVESIKKYITKGNIFCIITGRNYTDIKVLLNEYNIPYTYLICEDGAKIFNNLDYCIDTTYIDENLIENISKLLKSINCDYYLDDGYNKTEYLKDVVKIVVNCKDEIEKSKIVNIIKENFDIHIYASRYHVNIINKIVNKNYALNRLIDIEKINSEIYAIGDNDNDYEMLKYFKGGVIKKHHQILDELNKNEYDTLSDYIKELMEN